MEGLDKDLVDVNLARIGLPTVWVDLTISQFLVNLTSLLDLACLDAN